MLFRPFTSESVTLRRRSAADHDLQVLPAVEAVAKAVHSSLGIRGHLWRIEGVAPFCAVLRCCFRPVALTRFGLLVGVVATLLRVSSQDIERPSRGLAPSGLDRQLQPSGCGSPQSSNCCDAACRSPNAGASTGR